MRYFATIGARVLFLNGKRCKSSMASPGLNAIITPEFFLKGAVEKKYFGKRTGDHSPAARRGSTGSSPVAGSNACMAENILFALLPFLFFLNDAVKQGYFVVHLARMSCSNTGRQQVRILPIVPCLLVAHSIKA